VIINEVVNDKQLGVENDKDGRGFLTRTVTESSTDPPAVPTTHPPTVNAQAAPPAAPTQCPSTPGPVF